MKSFVIVVVFLEVIMWPKDINKYTFHITKIYYCTGVPMSENVSKNLIGSDDLKKNSRLVDENTPGRNCAYLIKLTNEPTRLHPQTRIFGKLL